jgi:hypothetical protein
MFDGATAQNMAVRESTPDYRDKSILAINAKDQVADKQLQTDLNIVLQEANRLMGDCAVLILDPNSKNCAMAQKRYRHIRNLAAKEISTGKRNLLLPLTERENEAKLTPLILLPLGGFKVQGRGHPGP